MDPEMDLKFAPKCPWFGKKPASVPENVSTHLRDFTLEHIADAIKCFRSSDFSYTDQVLETTPMLGAVSPRYGWSGEEIDLGIYFSMVRGNATLLAMEMTKWFVTNSRYLDPELSPEIKFSCASHKAVDEFEEAKELGSYSVPVIVGPVSYLLLSKPAKGVLKTFNLLSLLDSIFPFTRPLFGLKGISAIGFESFELML